MSTNAILSHYPSVQNEQEELYKDLHRHPELAFQEERTLGVVVDKLKALGFDVVEVGGGAVGTLENGEGPTVMLRADFDALPVKELTNLPYASTDTATDKDGNTVPVMHACGHDSHTACLLGMGEMMKANTDKWSGTLQLLFQPAEEIGAGANAMVDAGLVNKVARPDVVLGQHLFIGAVPAGHVAVVPGPFLSTSVNVDVVLHGEGSHGSMPHMGVDPVVMAASFVQKLQTIVARELSPHEFGVVTVGTIHGGTTPNVIPDRVTLGLNVRAYCSEVRERILASIERIAKAEAAAAGAPREPEITTHTRYPATNNDADVAATLADALRATLGPNHVHRIEPLTGSEDFPAIPTAFGVPYCYWVFGGGKEGVQIPNHSPYFAPDIQPTLATGTKALVAAACAFLA